MIKGALLVVVAGAAALGVYSTFSGPGVPAGHPEIPGGNENAPTVVQTTSSSVSDQASHRNVNSKGPDAASTDRPGPPVSASATSPHHDKAPPTEDLFGAVFAPIAGSGEHAIPSEAGAMHAKFQSEPVDANWSANVEANATNFFASQPSAGTANVSMECHSTICQVLMVGDSAGNDTMTQQQWEQWQRTVYMSPRQDWWSQYGLVDTVTNMTVEADGQIKAVTYFTKNPVTSQSPIKY
jgi:hypothetical protein